jgi:hypothetical protein
MRKITELTAISTGHGYVFIPSNKRLKRLENQIILGIYDTHDGIKVKTPTGMLPIKAIMNEPEYLKKHGKKGDYEDWVTHAVGVYKSQRDAFIAIANGIMSDEMDMETMRLLVSIALVTLSNDGNIIADQYEMQLVESVSVYLEQEKALNQFKT